MAADAGGNVLAGRLRAGWRGATDAILVGHGDEAEAALGAIPGAFSGAGFGPEYRASLRRARDQDRYDQAHFPVSRDVGEVIGTVGSLVATDGMAAAAAPRFAESAYSAARALPALAVGGRARLAAVGAFGGLAGQSYSDVLAGQPSGWRDYASSALGGAALTSSAPRVGPVYAAGLDATVRNLTDSYLNHVRPRIDQMARDVTGAGYLGGVGQIAGERESNALDRKSKGKLGESMSDARLALDGEQVVERQKAVKLGQGRSTRPDQILKPDPATGAQRFNDAKFGPTARPTASQRLAENVFPGSYQYHYWMPRHAGGIFGSILAGFGVPMLDRSDNQAVPYR